MNDSKKFWRSLLFIFLITALCGGLAIPFFYGACRYLLDQRSALLAALLLAIAPFHVRYGQEVRMYALLTLAVAVALYLFMIVLFDARARQKLWPWLGLGLAQAGVMLIHNTAAIFFPLIPNGHMRRDLRAIQARRGAPYSTHPSHSPPTLPEDNVRVTHFPSRSSIMQRTNVVPSALAFAISPGLVVVSDGSWRLRSAPE